MYVLSLEVWLWQIGNYWIEENKLYMRIIRIQV